MEITSFYPMIISEDIEATKATYEALGFKVAHVITDPLFDYKDQNQFVIMKNENGLRVGIYTGSEVKNIVTIHHPTPWSSSKRRKSRIHPVEVLRTDDT